VSEPGVRQELFPVAAGRKDVFESLPVAVVADPAVGAGSCAEDRASVSERLLDATEVAEWLGVPVSWVRESTRSGAMPCVELGRYRCLHPDAYAAREARKVERRRERRRGAES
jgi:hypothetical protein